MKVFVTGGTGLLGNNILRQLTKDGHELVALIRGQVDDEVFRGINTKFVTGDLSDQATIDQAANGCDVVIHSAALIHLGWTRLKESLMVNRDGTKTIVNACAKHGCKLVYVGTVNSLAIGRAGKPTSEQTTIQEAGDQILCSYVTSKREAAEVVRRAAQDGLQASMVHPGFMLGPWDWKPSSGRMMLEIARNWTPIAPSGGTSLCDARDVAAATIAAIQKASRDCPEYILAGHNMTYRNLWDEMSLRMNTQKTWMSAGPVQRWIGGLGGDLVTKVVGKEPDLNSAGIKMSAQFHYYDSTLAESELGYQIRDAAEILDTAAEWINERHL